MKDLQKFVFLMKNIRSILKVELDKQMERAEIKTYITVLNVKQLKEGKRSDGISLPDYSETSVKIYGKPAGAIKLFDTGDFYNSIEAKTEKSTIKLISTDPKYTQADINLRGRYGKEILGLTEKNIENVREKIISPLIIEIIQKTLKI